ncbi:hypothetical protein [Engelhardtia mirabilis]|uniref:Uncharacterized protein n=1 Tax=Engelhardtia mirabilis TaxID=2528011 RepID=A0A518BR42_9BACT|nr:hypothetical protein Pla133_45640 [Planctomycetes bacterium Pla133]QDV03770.1 hypothetical protein Pla86_45620 [Planctomycetes bacterium Pla86]
MLNLIASSPADGWAVVRADDGEVSLLRPPYDSADRETLTSSGLERVFRDGGFLVREMPFESWSSLVATLIRERREALGPDRLEAAARAAFEVLKMATSDQIRGHLARLREASLASGTGQAQLVLRALLDAPALLADPALMREAALLMAELATPVHGRHGLASRQSAWGVRRDSEVDRIDREISRRESILNFTPAA